MPFVPFLPTPATTPRARKLAKTLVDVIDSARDDDPRLTDRDVLTALRVAGSARGRGGPGPLLAFGLMLLVIGLIVFLMMQSPGR